MVSGQVWARARVSKIKIKIKMARVKARRSVCAALPGRTGKVNPQWIAFHAFRTNSLLRGGRALLRC